MAKVVAVVAVMVTAWCSYYLGHRDGKRIGWRQANGLFVSYLRERGR